MRILVITALFPGLFALILGAVPGRPAGVPGAGDPLAPEAIQERIRKHRTTEATVTVVGEDG